MARSLLVTMLAVSMTGCIATGDLSERAADADPPGGWNPCAESPCGEDSEPDAAPKTPGAYDSGTYDSGTYDSGAFDSGAFDSGGSDSGASEGGALDTGAVPAETAPVDPPPAEATKKVLPLIWKGQETGYWCGPGSTRMVLSARIAPPSQSTLASFMGTTTNGTDHVGLVVNALNHYLGTTRYRTKVMYDPPTTAQRDALKSDILALVGEGYGIVANVISGWRPPGYPGGTIYHYVAIVGYDDAGARVMIADPAAEGSGGSGWTNVPRTYWVSLGDLGTWIGGKGYTGR